MNKSLLWLYIPLTVMNFLFCKQTASEPETLKENTSSDTYRETSTGDACCDTVTINNDTADIALKEVETAPEILEAAKPVYTMDMIDNEVQGTVRLKLLVGRDGLISKYILLNDLGHGTSEAIDAAIRKMKFTAARKNKKRVSVWIETTLNFNLPRF